MTMSMQKPRTLMKPSQVMRLTKRGQLPSSIEGGKVHCEKCGNATGGDTESLTFWENGMYVHCPTCKTNCLARPIYPAIDGFPNGIQISLRGERKRYPLTLSE
jgi:hypothetical protein